MSINSFVKLLEMIWRKEEATKKQALEKEYQEGINELRRKLEEKYAPLTNKQKECLRQGYAEEKNISIYSGSVSAQILNQQAIINAQYQQGLLQQAAIQSVLQNAQSAQYAAIHSAATQAGYSLVQIIHAIEDSTPEGAEALYYDSDAAPLTDRRRQRHPMKIKMISLASMCLANGRDVAGALLLLDEIGIPTQ